jgi:hypothetical protein
MKTLEKTRRYEKGNRFGGRLDRNHGRCLLRYDFNEKRIEIRMTDHSTFRLEGRGCDIKKALHTVTKLGRDNLNRHATKGIDVGINDYPNGHTVILTFEKDGEDYVQVRFRTIINRPNAFIKNDTIRIVMR